jgi:hypothetical protein
MKVVEMRPMGGYFWFLSFNLQLLHYWLFPKPKQPWKRWLQMPFQLSLQFIFFLVLPIFLFYLDRLDKIKDHSMGWVCIAEKMSKAEMQEKATPGQ